MNDHRKQAQIHKIDLRIAALQKYIAKYSKKHNRLVELRAALANGEVHTKYIEERYVVASVELRPLIQEWIDTGNSIKELERTSGVSHKTLTNILRRGQKFVYASNADKILVALNATHIFLKEVPNPKLRQLPSCDE